MEEKGTFKKVELEEEILEKEDPKHLGDSDNQELMSDQVIEQSAFQEASSQGDKPAKTGFFDDITNLFTAPSVLMESLSRRPKVLVPFLLMIGLGAMMSLFSKQAYLKDMLDIATQQNPTMDPNMIRMQMESSYILSIIGSALGGILACLILAVIFLLIGKLMGGEGTYKKVLSTLSYSYVIVAFGGFLAGIGKMLTGSFFFDFSPMIFIGEKMFTSPMLSLLALLNPFYIWYLIVASIGMSKAHQMEQKKSTLLVFGTSIFIQVGLVFIGLLMKGMTGQ